MTGWNHSYVCDVQDQELIYIQSPVSLIQHSSVSLILPLVRFLPRSFVYKSCGVVFLLLFYSLLCLAHWSSCSVAIYTCCTNKTCSTRSDCCTRAH